MPAQTPDIPGDATPDQIKKIKDDATARKEALDALAAEITARKALATAQDSGKPPLADQVAAAKAAKELADARKSQADAEKAQADAALAAAKAKFGEVPASGYTGTAEMGAGAGNAEAMLLGSKAVREIAAKFAVAIRNQMPRDIHRLFLFTAGTTPTFQALLAFDAQSDALKFARHAAIESTQGQGSGVALATSVATGGLGLDAINKVLGYFKSDFKFQGIDVASSDAMLLAALAEQLRRQRLLVQVPAIYQPAPAAGVAAPLEKIAQPFAWGQEAHDRQRQHENDQADLETRLAALQKVIADAATLPGDKARAEGDAQTLQARLKKAKEAVGTWKALADRIDAWTRQLTTADDKGNVPLAATAQQAMLRDALDNGAALVVLQLHKVAGSGYAKKNLWSTLGANPFHVMGGAVASVTAFHGKTGEVFASSLLPWHGGYHSVSDVMLHVNGSALAREN